MLRASLLRILLTRSFHPFVFNGRFENQLQYAGLEDLGLYVHIPFCRSLCSFCPYYKVVYNQPLAQAYKDALLKEIDLVCHEQHERLPVTSLYFGGGTPALLVDDLKEIIDRLRQYFEIGGGVGVEIHPDDITGPILAKLKAAGVTMVSIGAQSFDEGCLQKLGRSNIGLVDKMQLVRQAGFDVVDVDLIFAIPGQTDELLIKDIQTAFALGATQVSTYPFIDFTFADNQYRPMSKLVKKQMLSRLIAYSRSAGLVRTSVWTFAKPGSGRYSSITRDNFLGFGASATTLLKDIFKINTFSIEPYIERIQSGNLPTSLTLDFSRRQRAVYFLFWSAYGLQVNPEKFARLIGVPLQKMYGFEISLACKLGYLRQVGDQYELTDKAAMIYHDIEQVYTTAYIDKMWRISRIEPFPRRIVLR